MSLLFEISTVDKGAHFSPCRQYRYQLWRIWDESMIYEFSGMRAMRKQFRAYTKTEKRELSIEQRMSRLIARCFNDVNFNYQVFHCGDYTMKSESGETKFYEASPIDNAIRKMNRITRWLTRQRLKE